MIRDAQSSSALSLLLCFIMMLVALPLRGEEGIWVKQTTPPPSYLTEGKCYYEEGEEKNTVTDEVRKYRETISCQEDCKNESGGNSSGGSPSFSSSSSGGSGCGTCGQPLSTAQYREMLQQWKSEYRLRMDQMHSEWLESNRQVEVPPITIWVDPWGNQQASNGWSSDPLTAAAVFAPHLSLGASSYGTPLGFLAVTPDLATTPITAPLTLADVQSVLTTLMGSLETGVMSQEDTNTGLWSQQYSTPDTLIQIVEQAGGTLKILCFRLSETSLVSGQTWRTVPVESAAVTNLTVSRTELAGLPAFTLKGTYLGAPYEASMGTVETSGGGVVSLREQNGVRSEMVDAYVADSADYHDGLARLRSTAVYMRDPETQAWVRISSRVIKSRTLLNNREVAVEEVVTAADNTALTTTYTYDELEFVNSHLNKSYGRLASERRPDGSWVRYEYDEEGRLWRTMRPWLNAPATPAEATATNCEVETIVYFPTGTPWQGERSIETRILGTLMSGKNTVAEPINIGSNNGLRVTEVVTRHRLNASGSVTAYAQTTVKDYLLLPDQESRLVMSTAPSGTKSAHDEVKGTLNVNGSFTVNETGDKWAHFTWSHLTSQAHAEAGHSIRTMQIKDDAGLVLREVKAVATTTGAYATATYVDYDGSVFVYDAKGRLAERRLLNGAVEESITRVNVPNPLVPGASLGETETHKDGEGTRTETQWNTKGEVLAAKLLPGSVSRSVGLGYYVQGAVETRLERTGITAHQTITGSTLVTTTISNDNPLAPTGSISYKVVDAAGRTVKSSLNGRITDHTYAQGGRVQTMTSPGSVTQITTRFLSGQIQSLTGTGAVAEYHDFTVNADGSITETLHIGTANSSRWRSVTRDYTGTVLKESSPNPENPAQTVTMSYYHDDAGRVVKVKRPGLADELTTYRTNGEVYRRGLDLNQNGTLDVWSNDTLTEMDTVIEIDAQGKAWQVMTQQVLAESSGLPYTTALTSTTKRSLGTGSTIQTKNTEPDGSSVLVTRKPNRSTGITEVTYEGSSIANTKETQVRGQPVLRSDSSQNTLVAMRYSCDGQLISRTNYNFDGSYPIEELYFYTGDRQISTVWRGGVLVQSYTRYPINHANAGQIQTITNANAGVTSVAYNTRGQETARSGTGTYPLERVYTGFGEVEKLKTWRTVGGTAALTTWDYQDQTGLLLSKTDAANHAVTYTYDQAGRMKTRTNARSIVATYSYDGAGRLTGIDYSDSTPDVTLQLDRAGRTVQATDATGTRVLSYSSALPGGQESRVTWAAGSLLPLWDFWRTTYGHRRNGWLVSQRGAAQSQVVETHNGDRIAEVEFAELVNSRAIYNLNHQVHDGDESSVAYPAKQPDGSWGFFADKRSAPENGDYDETIWCYGADGTALWNLSWEDAFMTQGNARLGVGGPITSVRHTRSAEGLHAMRDVGSKMQETGVNYNPRGEVKGTTKTFFEGATERLLPGGAQRWQFDAIGNRTTASQSKLNATITQAKAGTEARQSATYTPNTLNQYDTITRENPLLRLVQGEVRNSIDTSLTVSLINGGSTQVLTTARVVTGENPFVAEASVDVSAGAQWRKLRVQATRSGAGPGGSALTATREGWMFFPPATETLVHDLDGNLTSDARWTYVWDAENRIIAMEEKTIAGSGPARKRLEFTYDHLSRRLRKLVRSAEGVAAGVASTNWPVTKDRRFIYDGWNMIAEIDASITDGSLALFRSYAWGNDVSGTPQGAGGVGGLLMIQERDLRRRKQALQTTPPAVYAPCTDPSGNILAYIEINRGEGLTHSFEYDAFGKELTADTLVPTGTTKETMPFRFSTKYHDDETGFAYYGYRFYNPELGRWLNGDPIGEQGGINLYAMAGNDAVNHVDVLGLARIDAESSFHVTNTVQSLPSGYDGAITMPTWSFSATTNGNVISINEASSYLTYYNTSAGSQLHEDQHVSDWRLEWSAFVDILNSVNNTSTCCPEQAECMIEVLALYRNFYHLKGAMRSEYMHAFGNNGISAYYGPEREIAARRFNGMLNIQLPTLAKMISDKALECSKSCVKK